MATGGVNEIDKNWYIAEVDEGIGAREIEDEGSLLAEEVNNPNMKVQKPSGGIGK